jgi:putative DNA primase/helicase
MVGSRLNGAASTAAYVNSHDWRDEEVERTAPLTDVSVDEVLEGALGIEPARWTKADLMRVGAYLKTRHWERYQARKGDFREWRYRR